MKKPTKKQEAEFAEIETKESHYLDKYYHFLKFAEDELFYGFRTKEDIQSDWIDKYKSGISDFAVGAERIVYSLLNGKGIGQPNSAPVGADLFFETNDAYIHIDLKTVGASLKNKSNIGDFTTSIFVGENQNSYKGKMLVKGEERDYQPNLPTFYNQGTKDAKICLSYFIGILYDRDSLDILVIYIVSMPNGELEPHYRTKVLQAGKNLEKTRFKFTNVPNFDFLGNVDRMKTVYFNKNMDELYREKLKFFEDRA